MTGEGASGPASVYVGVGVGVYDDTAFGELGHAVPDAEELGKLLAERGYRVDVVADPTGGQAGDRLRDLMPGDLLAAGGALVVMWAGHGEPSSQRGLHLVTKNSHPGEEPRMSADEPAYLWRYMWRHCAEGGDVGIAVLRTLADRDQSAFLPDLAAASDALATRRARSGQPRAAVAPAEEAVALWREQAAANPAFTPNLAVALDNLGCRYSEVGRRGEAVAPAEEAVALWRELAAADPAFTPDVAGALDNLGNRYSEAGHGDEKDRIWDGVLREFQSQPDREVSLRLARAAGRPPPDVVQAIDDVLAALSAAGDEGSLRFQCRDLLRSLRAQGPADFDAAWVAAGQARPTWLLLDQATVDLIRTWLTAPTWRASLDFARDHLDALLALQPGLPSTRSRSSEMRRASPPTAQSSILQARTASTPPMNPSSSPRSSANGWPAPNRLPPSSSLI
jgi:tetratricopeptide (TPR) repeat protein